MNQHAVFTFNPRLSHFYDLMLAEEWGGGGMGDYITIYLLGMGWGGGGYKAGVRVGCRGLGRHYMYL